MTGVVNGAGVWRVPSLSCPPFPFQAIPPNQVPKVPPQDGGSFTITCPDNEVKYYACPGKQDVGWKYTLGVSHVVASGAIAPLLATLRLLLARYHLRPGAPTMLLTVRCFAHS
jgi:hypothetical protein